MRAVVVDEAHNLRVDDVAAPPDRDGFVRINVAAAGVNRADLLQREGRYPPPPGASPILGLECSGRAAGTNERVMALLPGGGYAEEVVVHRGSAMRVPDALTDEEAGALPEVFLTAFLNVFMMARARAGETLLIHGGGSGVGTAATTLAKLAGLRVIVTAGSDEKCRQCLTHGADVAINYKTDDFAEKAGPVDIVLDHIGARYLPHDLRLMKTDGRIVIIGSMGGQRSAEIDVTALLSKRVQIIGSTLRSRSDEEKAAIVSAFLGQFGEHLNAGRIKPVVHRVFTMEEAAEAHELMRRSEHFGKIVLIWSAAAVAAAMDSGRQSGG
jgi:putative PIG3 family NAD(P)H quinone oxidoreductase